MTRAYKIDNSQPIYQGNPGIPIPKKVFGKREYRLYGTTFSSQTAARQKAWLELRGYHVIEEVEHGVNRLWIIPSKKWVGDIELEKLSPGKIVELDNPGIARTKRNPNKKNSRTIKETAGLGMALIASEHFFSSMLTSPMTTKRFFSTSEEGIKDTMDALRKAVGLSIVSGIILSCVSKSWTPIVTTAAVSAFYWTEYTNALKGEI